MRSAIFAVAAMAHLAAALPQDIPFDLAYALPNPSYTTVTGTGQVVTYNPSTVFAAASAQITSSNTNTALDTTTTVPTDVSTVAKRAAACTSQPVGYGPVPSPDSPSAFASFSSFAAAASQAPVPSGYTQNFQNLNASNNAYGYMGYMTMKTYDTNACAAKCNAINGCISFNIYFERDPTVDPGTGNSGCANPPSTTNIKCVWWGGPVDANSANNYGQLRNQFQVVVAGSNGYTNSSVAAVPGYGEATPLGKAAINAPYDKYGFNSFMGSVMFVGAFNAQLCAQACTDKSNYALAHPPTDGTPVQTCQFFNTYILYINSTNNIQGQVCSMYSESWPASYATNVGQYQGHDHFLIEYSFSYSNLTNPGSAQPLPAVYQAKQDILWPANSAAPYCSSILGGSGATSTTTVTTQTTSLTTTFSTTTVTTTTTAAPANAPSKRNDDAAALAARSAVPEPNVLSKYPASIVSSACVLAAPGVSTVTTTVVVQSTSSSVTTTTTTTTAAAFATQAAMRLDSDYTWFGVGDTPSPGDGNAIMLDGYPPGSEEDIFHLGYAGGPISVVTSAIGDDQGFTLYYDPVGAFYGPTGANGLGSFVVAVPPNDPNTASTVEPVNCNVDASGYLNCQWGNTGANGDFWFCGGYVTLFEPGFDVTQFTGCTQFNNGYVARIYDVAWAAPGSS